MYDIGWPLLLSHY